MVLGVLACRCIPKVLKEVMSQWFFEARCEMWHWHSDRRAIEPYWLPGMPGMGCQLPPSGSIAPYFISNQQRCGQWLVDLHFSVA